jgi:hypothetical protein
MLVDTQITSGDRMQALSSGYPLVGGGKYADTGITPVIFI